MIYDVSYCQPKLKVSDLPDVEKLIIRLGTLDHKDTQAERFISECINLRVPFELYWYVEAVTPQECEDEAEAIVKIYSDIAVRYKCRPLLWLDIEKTENTKKYILNDVYKSITKESTKANISTGLYTFLSAYEENYEMFVGESYPKWVAWHNQNKTIHDVRKKCLYAQMWQAGAMEVSGITVDYNYMLRYTV